MMFRKIAHLSATQLPVGHPDDINEVAPRRCQAGAVSFTPSVLDVGAGYRSLGT